MASRWRSQIIGTAIEMYWWMRAKVRGWTSEVAPFGADSGSSSAPSTIRLAVPLSINLELLVVEACELRRSHGQEQRVRPPAVRVVGRVDDLLGCDLPVEVEEVDALHTEVSKSAPGMPPRRPARPAMSAIPACATMSRTPS